MYCDNQCLCVAMSLHCHRLYAKYTYPAPTQWVRSATFQTAHGYEGRLVTEKYCIFSPCLLFPIRLLHSPWVTVRVILTTPAIHLRDWLLSVPPCSRDISRARHIHNTYASRVIKESEAITIPGYSSPQVDPLEGWLLWLDRINLCGLTWKRSMRSDTHSRMFSSTYR